METDGLLAGDQIAAYQFPDPTTVTLCLFSWGPSVAILCNLIVDEGMAETEIGERWLRELELN